MWEPLLGLLSVLVALTMLMPVSRFRELRRCICLDQQQQEHVNRPLPNSDWKKKAFVGRKKNSVPFLGTDNCLDKQQQEHINRHLPNLD